MLGRVAVSGGVLQGRYFFRRCKAGNSFLDEFVRSKDCFIYSSFLAGKEAKEAGGTYDGSPLTPFQRPTGAQPLSVDPAQWDGVDVSRPVEAEKRRAGDVPPPRY